MEGVISAVAGVYAVGLFLSPFIYKSRAGLKTLGKVNVAGQGGVGMGWIIRTLAKMITWPIVLAVWLANGRPDPSVAFDRY